MTMRSIPTRTPELSYKLSTATAKAISILLNSERDWKGFQKEVISQQKTKKRSIPVNILVPDHYLKSLEAMGPKKLGRSQLGGHSIRSRKTVLMDLNGDSDDDNHALTKCQLCGPGKFCKISKTGEHANLTWNQRRAWSIALADIFHMFFASLSGPATSTATPAPPPAAPAPGMITPFNFMMSPWMMPPFGYPGQVPNNPFYPPLKSPSHHRSHYLQDEIPSSDPPDESLENPYPSITSFLQQLNQKHAQCGLSRHFNIFEEKDFYNINEVTNITAERLSLEEFSFTAGNAQFFLDAVHKEMKHIDRAMRKGKSHQY
ncbi:hypothetical protein BYT27DRAFT_7224817 [Phlegmacium glaucopus]|nr:hypothetical protein BYT27DRAFT_7224817 [Phlegmacium glaucopus]